MRYRAWFTLTNLPTDMIPYAAQALTHYIKGESYAERDWDEPSATHRSDHDHCLGA